MAWYEPDSSYYEPNEVYSDGWYHKDEYDPESAADALQEIIKAVYETGNLEDLEQAIEYGASALKVVYAADKLKIAKKADSDKKDLMHWYLGYQRSFIESQKEKA